jgi:hypothetical protein
MASEARAAGLELDRRYLASFRPNPKGDRPDERRGWIRMSEIARGKAGRGIRRIEAGVGEIHDSALKLLLADPAYRPSNLLAHLKSNPEALAGQPPDTRRALEAIAERAGAGRADPKTGSP